MQYHYTARGINGQSSAGLIEAASLPQARQQLRASGLFPIRLLPEAAGRAATPIRPDFRWSRKQVRRSDLLMTTSQLAIMCRAGIDLAEALRSVSRECRHPVLRDVLTEIYTDVSQGASASAAISKHRELFGDAYVASIAAAEASGAISEVLPRLADMLRNEIRLQSSLKSMAAYPVVLLAVATIVLTVLVFFVLPQFAHVFASLGRPAPPLTALLLSTAQFLRENVLWAIVAAVAAIATVRHVVRTEAACRYWDEMILTNPLVRNGSRALLTGRVFRMLGITLHSGVPLLEAVRLCRNSVRNRLFRELLRDVEVDVVNGRGIGTAIGKAEFIPAGAAQMIATAERTGKLGDVMQLVGEFYEEEGEQLIRSSVKLLEPVIIIVMGVVVAAVVLSVILPLLDVSTISHGR